MEDAGLHVAAVLSVVDREAGGSGKAALFQKYRYFCLVYREENSSRKPPEAHWNPASFLRPAPDQVLANECESPPGQGVLWDETPVITGVIFVNSLANSGFSGNSATNSCRFDRARSVFLSRSAASASINPAKWRR